MRSGLQLGCSGLLLRMDVEGSALQMIVKHISAHR